MKFGALALTAGLCIAFASPALAQKVRIGCTLSNDCGVAAVAHDEGLFEKHGLDVEMVRIAVGGTIAPALLSNSIDIGGPTASLFVQAVDGGLDLVAISGASVMHEEQRRYNFVYLRNGVTIENPQDFVGKKIGVPGFSGYFHLMFVRYLIANGVDPAEVDMVETSFSSMPDLIRNGSVDGVVVGSSNAIRLRESGLGSVGPNYAAALGGDAPIGLFASTRAWAEANPELVEKFRAALQEAQDLIEEDREVVVMAGANWLQQAPEIVRAAPETKFRVDITAEDVGWWVDLMAEQGLLQGDIDLTAAIAPSR